MSNNLLNPTKEMLPTEHCSLVRIAGRDSFDGYHIVFNCMKCGAKGTYHNQDVSDIRFEKDNPDFDKTQFKCPGEKYVQDLITTSHKNLLSKLQVKKGDVVSTALYPKGRIIKYPDNKHLVISTKEFDSELPSLDNGHRIISKEEILKILS